MLKMNNSYNTHLDNELVCLRGSDNSDLTGLETSKIRNAQFQHISMYYSYLVHV